MSVENQITLFIRTTTNRCRGLRFRGPHEVAILAIRRKIHYQEAPRLGKVKRDGWSLSYAMDDLMR
jgi:hypothetical protein